MDLRDYIRILRKRWLPIALITALGVALGAGFSLLSPKVYSATTQNFVSIGQSTTNNSNAAVYSGAAFTLQRVKSYVDVVTSPQVLAPVIAQTGVDLTVPQLATMVTAVNPPQTVLINVTVKDGSAPRAVELANAVAVSFANQVAVLETPPGATESPVKMTITSPATGAGLVSPNTKVNVALGLILGLGLGIAYAIIREQLDTTIKSESDLGHLTGSTNLGLITFDSEAQTSPLVALNQTSVRAEGFRTVRTNLQYVDVDEPPKAVVITSALPSEGKTTSACNLAITLAQAGSKVCLVEADLRKPKVAEYLGIAGSVGLVDILSGQIPLADGIVSWRRGLLSVIPSGPIPPNPSEMLGSRQMAHMLEELRNTYDIIIIDAPPLLPVTDAAVLARNADGALMVTRFGRTTRDQVRKASLVLENVGARLLGTVLNFVPTRGGSYGYGYGYGYGGYGYGYGYGHKRSEKKGRKDTQSAPAEVDATTAS
ncbi:MAG: hypothetical protein RLZ55_830, partial [Actinomycetota bacterium]